MPFILSILFLVLPLFAGVEKISLKNLDLEYESIYGQGTFEKFGIGIGMSSLTEAQEFLIYKRENSFDLTIGHIDFEWVRPIPFVFDLK